MRYFGCPYSCHFTSIYSAKRQEPYEKRMSGDMKNNYIPNITITNMMTEPVQLHIFSNTYFFFLHHSHTFYLH